VDDSPGYDQLKAAFDRVIPAIKTRPTPDRSALAAQAEPAEQPKPADTPPPPVTQPKEVPDTTPPPTTEPAKQPADASHDVPSFLEQALRGEAPTATPSSSPAEEEWPEELPTFKNSEEAKSRYKKWRESYNTKTKELKSLQEKPTLNAQQLERMEFLENQNREMHGVLTRVGVEQSAEFQNNVIRPLHAAWNDAARIVKQAGGDPQALASAMSMQGKAQFEALDNLFSELPESAKIEANEALRAYRRYEDARRATLANAPAAMEGIRKRELERQYAEVNSQREGMKTMFDDAVGRLRNEVEIFRRTTEPEGKWWNDQAEQIESQARELYLDNTDMGRVAMACLLAPAASAYRKLWIASQKKIGQLQNTIKEKLGNEPTLSESSGNGASGSHEAQMAEDLKKPFADVFLREFHRSQARNR
jgi:hypothetical protein